MVHFLAFSLRRAAEGLWRHPVTSIAAVLTMVLMLLMVAGLLIVLSGLQAGLRFVEEKVEVQATLNEGVSRELVGALEADLRALPQVASVTYVSKEQAREDFRAFLRSQGKEDLSEYTGTNPYPANLSIRLRDPDAFGQVAETLRRPRGVVREIYERQQLAESISTIADVIRTVGFVVVAVVGLIVLLIVINTIRMAVMARAQEIEIMRLVGASDAFIRWPFIFEGLLVGLLGALITLALLALGSQPIGQLTFLIASRVPVGFNQQLAQQVVAIVLASGLGLGGLGAYISVRTYLTR